MTNVSEIQLFFPSHNLFSKFYQIKQKKYITYLSPHQMQIKILSNMNNVYSHLGSLVENKNNGVEGITLINMMDENPL